MIFLDETVANPFSYMGNLWYVMMVVLGVCIVLLVVLRPLHKLWTDRKTRAIIEMSGGPAPEPPARKEAQAEPEPGGDDD